MIEIEILAENTTDILVHLQEAIGGEIVEEWSECTLTINNEFATGSLRFIPFDWGVYLLEIDAIFHKEIRLKIKANKEFNPLRFIYNLSGTFKHKFDEDQEEKLVEEYQSLIYTNKYNGYNHIYFPKEEKLEINIIQIVRKKFLKKKTTNAATLNKKLYEVFVDTKHENRFVHFGQLNLKLADHIKRLKKIKEKGMLRVLKIEAKVYEILSLHIQQHNRVLKGVALPTSLLKSELKTIRKIAAEIIENPSLDYSLDQLSSKSGLSQAKLQDGFKFLYNRTVTEYIRNIRLESARDLLKNTDLNISQIVYSIGFTSRSYFSKIFRKKYGITPNQFKKKLVSLVRI